MSIKREMKVVNETGLRKPVYTQNNAIEITNIKGKIRRDVGRINTADGQPYDLSDQLADMCNAMNALLAIAEAKGWNVEIDASNPIDKYRTRQTEALTIKSSYTS